MKKKSSDKSLNLRYIQIGKARHIQYAHVFPVSQCTKIFRSFNGYETSEKIRSLARYLTPQSSNNISVGNEPDIADREFGLKQRMKRAAEVMLLIVKISLGLS